MRILVTLGLLFCTAPAVAATGCEDVWFTRNLIMDRAGYCFGSPLGQALFDNSDCIGRQVRLDPASQAVVARIQALEAQHGCRVDTSRTWLDLPDINFRKALDDLPIADDFEWGCLGWTGPPTPLYTGYREPFRTIGQIAAGDWVGFGYMPVGEWSYVTVHAPGWAGLRSAGWLYRPQQMPCAEEAG